MNGFRIVIHKAEEKKIYPAVDIKDGKCVRLKQGLASESTVYFEDPADARQGRLQTRALK